MRGERLASNGDGTGRGGHVNFEGYDGEDGHDNSHDLRPNTQLMEGMLSPEDSMRYLYRDTTATNPLPSELVISDIMRSHYARNAGYGHHHDFSYRGEEDINGRYQQ